jgi:hypothetical protein
MSDDRGSTVPGFVNRHGQVTIRNTSQPGTDHLQYTYQLACSKCGHVYGANGSDIHERKCPVCQAGRSGIQLTGVSESSEPIMKAICAITGCTELQVIKTISEGLKHLHRVAFCHEHNVTEAVMQSMWCFGGEACFHFGGILEQARIHNIEDIPWSEFFLRFAPDLGNQYGRELDTWLDQRSKDRKRLDDQR